MANIPISSFTAAANATGIGMSGFSLTGANAQSMLDLAGTWNTSGTPTGLKLNVTDTASNAASLLMDLQVGGATRFRVSKAGQVNLPISASSTAPGYTFDDYKAGIGYIGSTIRIVGGNNVLWSNIGADYIQIIANTAQFYFGSDTILARDAANTLAQRNGTNAQTLRVYNTFTDASNYERGFVQYSGNVLQIGHEALGTGIAGRSLALLAGGTNYFSVGGGSGVWLVNTSGHLVCTADNTRDIGASGANRPRDLYLAGVATIGGNTSAFGTITLRGATEAARRFNVNGFASMRWPSDGVYTFLNDGASDFGRLQFGGTTASFPALKRNGTALETKLADDSAYAPHSMQYTEITDGITAPGAAAGRARIYVDTADGDLKVVFADGTVKTIVTDT